MVIVKTKNDDQLISEREMMMVTHDHEKEEVCYQYRVKDGGTRIMHIPNVETMIYDNGVSPFRWEDKGSRLAELEEDRERLGVLRQALNIKIEELEYENMRLKEKLERYEKSNHPIGGGGNADRLQDERAN